MNPGKQQNKPVFGLIHSTESFGSVDGPGIRFVVFTQGRRMACKYCHNPDAWACEGGTLRDAESLLNEALRYRSYWNGGGGITVSGGEPLLQLDFLLDFFERAKKEGVHTAIDTSGEPFSRNPDFLKTFTRLLNFTDLIMLDIKHIDSKAHSLLTGKPNENILDMARFLSDAGKTLWIRHVVVPGVTALRACMERLRRFIDALKTVEKVEALPYHSLAAAKWRALGRSYPLEGVKEPSAECMREAEEILLKTKLAKPGFGTGSINKDCGRFTGPGRIQ
ncbi:MAG: pyruvate formate lyase-activating protein [Spirochaetaceae bacterium]|nr:pyruvate formate lyase-activating protein [Spirochaetaceae bacterium]